jgi:hypothetical protein
MAAQPHLLIDRGLTYSLFLKDIHMQNIDWVELGFFFMRTNGDIPPTVFMFGKWTEYNLPSQEEIST